MTSSQNPDFGACLWGGAGLLAQVTPSGRPQVVLPNCLINSAAQDSLHCPLKGQPERVGSPQESGSTGGTRLATQSQAVKEQER